MQKGITPVVAVILLLLITISVAGFAMVFMQRLTQGAAESGEAQLNQQLSSITSFDVINIDGNKVYIRNTGAGTLSGLSFYVDGAAVQNATPVLISPGTTAEVVLNSSQLAMVPGDKLRVTSSGYQQEREGDFYSKNTLAYWRFDEADREKIKDYSGNGNDGTFQGETWNDGTLSPACPNCPVQTSGKYGNALRFDGVDDYISVPDSASLNTANALTVEAWINPTSVGYTQSILEKNIGEAINTQYALFIYPGESTIYFRVVKGGGLYNAKSNALPPTSAWTHVAGRYDGNEVSIWINGVKQSTTATVAAPLDKGSGTLQIGRNPSATYFFNGTIDEVRIYNRALTQGEIVEDMNSAHPINRTVASWSFEKIDTSPLYNNPSFEADLNGWANAGGFASAGIDTSVSKDGYKSLKISQQTGNTGGFFVTNDFIPVVPGQFVSLGAWIKGQNIWQSVGHCNPQVSTHLYDTNKQLIQNWFVDLGGINAGDTDWAEFYSGRTVPSNGAYIRPQAGFDCSGNDVTGTAWFDNVRLNIATKTLDTHNVVKGKYGAALSFDGVDDYVNAGNDASLQPYSELTLEAWTKPNDLTGWHMILSKSGDYAGNPYMLGTYGSSLGIQIDPDNAGADTYTAGTLSTGIWQHVAGVFSSSEGKLNLYINGAESSRDTTAENAGDFPGRYLNIGRRGDAEYFNGTIDEARILNVPI